MRANDFHTHPARAARAIARRNADDGYAAIRALQIGNARRRTRASEHIPIRRRLARREGIRVGTRHRRIVHDLDDEIGGRIAVALQVGHHHRKACAWNANSVVEQRIAISDRAFAC